MSATRFETVAIADLVARDLAPDASPQRPVVLVVDDERIIADTLVAILNTSGYAASAAYDGRSALEMAELVPPNLLLSDVVMPGMNGVDLAISVKRAVPDCRTLLFSGQASTSDLLVTARDSGYDFTVLSKPVHPHELLAHASRLLTQSA